jgi:threonine/homoserine/homoserine lactone efflux protein
MTDYIWHFVIGMSVSIWGSIPLGTVNLGVIQTSVNRNFKAGIYFAIGATLVELVYSSIAVKCLSVLLVSQPQLKLWIEVIAVPVFIILGCLSIRKKASSEGQKVTKRKSFFEGIIIGLVNPLQIPFWIAYSSYLLSNSWIKDDQALLSVFIIGICFGTLFILILIAALSRKFLSAMNFGGAYINKIIGFVFFGLAFYQVIKLSLSFWPLNPQ